MQQAALLRKRTWARRRKTFLTLVVSFAVGLLLDNIGYQAVVKNGMMILLLVSFGFSAWATILMRRAARMTFEVAERSAAYQASIAAPVSPSKDAQIRIKEADPIEPTNNK